MYDMYKDLISDFLFLFLFLVFFFCFAARGRIICIEILAHAL